MGRDERQEIYKKKKKKMSPRQSADEDDAQIEPNASTDSENHAIEIYLDCKRFTFLGFFLFVLFPLLPLFLATIFGGLLALVEDVTFRKGFLYVVSNLLGMANPLTEYSPSGKIAAIIIDLYVAVTALITFGIMLNVVNLFQVPLAMNHFIERFTTNPIAVPLIALGIMTPFFTAALSAIFGSCLALVENWAIIDGILYVFSNCLGLGTPLTNVVPTTVGGAIVDIVISSIALGYFAIFADYVTVLNPSKSLRGKFRACLGAIGVIDLAETPDMHPLDYDNVPDRLERSCHSDEKYDDNKSNANRTHTSVEIETCTNESERREAWIAENLTLPRPPSKSNLKDYVIRS